MYAASAVAAGRYRSVNMAGAAFICAAMNAIGRRDLLHATITGDEPLVAALLVLVDEIVIGARAGRESHDKAEGEKGCRKPLHTAPTSIASSCAAGSA